MMRRTFAGLLIILLAWLVVVPAFAGLEFDGSNDKVDHGDINAIDGAAAFTIMMWVRPDDVTTATRRALFKKGAAGLSPTLTQGGAGTVAGTRIGLLTDPGNFGEAADVYASDTWVHIAYVFDGGQADNATRLVGYKNAASLTLSFTGTIPATLPSSASTVEIGGDYDDFFSGTIAHVKAWTAALSAAEVAQEMNSYRPQRTASLTLWAPYDDATNAHDYSGNGNDGTVTEASQVTGPPVGFGAP